MGGNKLKDRYLKIEALEEDSSTSEAEDTLDALFHLPDVLLNDIYAIHQALEALVGERLKTHYLWSLEIAGQGAACLVRSAALPPTLRSDAAPIPRLSAGDEVPFEVTANPSAKSSRDNRRRPFAKSNDSGRLAWFERRATLAGFEARNVSVVTGQRWIERKGRRFWLDASTYSGRLLVVDADAFTKTMCRGFGYGRPWGFGLLKVFV